MIFIFKINSRGTERYTLTRVYIQKEKYIQKTDIGALFFLSEAEAQIFLSLLCTYSPLKKKLTFAVLFCVLF